MDKKIEIIEKSICYDGFFKMLRYRVRHSLFSGGWSNEIVREVFERGHAVAVLPYDPVHEKIVMIEQFRIGAIEWGSQAWLWEIVAGIIGKNETQNEVARREVQEEMGCTVLDLIPICHFFVSPGGTTETTALFCGRIDSLQAQGIHGLKTENEDIQVHVISLSEATELLEQGKIQFAPAIIALQWLLLHLDEVKKRWH
jgi:ADP-ribose pyrophosphatase